MGYKNFSELCPIFNTDNDSGLEHEMVIPYFMGSCTVTTQAMFAHAFGREVVVQEIIGHVYHSTTAFACVSNSCSVAIFKTTLSTAIGSLAFGSVDCSITGDCRIDGSITSTAFTSTDLLILSNLTFAQQGRVITAGGPPTIVVRYREK